MQGVVQSAAAKSGKGAVQAAVQAAVQGALQGAVLTQAFPRTIHTALKKKTCL